MIYLDWASTALSDHSIIELVKENELRFFGNPSAIHTVGRQARELVENSRSRIANALRATPGEIVFTSGGTESNNMILFSLLSRIQKTGTAVKITLITTGIEHPSVFDVAVSLERFGVHVVFIQPDNSGIIDPDKIGKKLDEHTVLVSVMMVNNETGCVQRVHEISKIVHDFSSARGRKIIFHVDAVQAFGKIPFLPRDLGIDVATLSCHKLGGPKGVGALFIDRELRPEFLFRGGDQETNRRPGTENTPGCFGFALTCEKRIAMLDENIGRAKQLIAHQLIEGLRVIGGAVLIPEARNQNDDSSLYSPFILKVAFPHVPGEVLVRVLDEKGVMVSTGAACSSRKQKEKHRVLLNMGVPLDIAESSIRISIGYETGKSDIDYFLDVLGRELPALRKISGIANR
jgi:cysteine desulfurase